MAVEALGAVVLQKLTDLLIDDSIIFDNVIDQIEDIRVQLRRMRGFLIDAELRDDHDSNEWATGYLRVLFSAEDKIENYVLSLSASGSRSIGFFQRHGLTPSCGPGRSLRRKLDSLADEIKNLENIRPGEVEDASLRAGNTGSDEEEKKFTAVGRSRSDILCSPVSLSPRDRNRFLSMRTFPSSIQRRHNFRFGSPSPRHGRSPRSIASPDGYHGHPKATYPDQEGPVLTGFTRDQEQLVDRLKERGGRGVIPLVGDPGSGKTTLVKAIFSLREIKNQFDCRAWVHVPHESITGSQLLANLLQQVQKSKEGGIPNADQLITRVKDSLGKKTTYLVVLDHVSDVRIWDEMKDAFPGLEVGNSKVIIITREKNVAATPFVSEQDNGQPHHLRKLCDEHSWELLTKKAGLDEENNQLGDGLRDEILRKCNGCPLEIVLLGGLLSANRRCCDDEWKWCLNQPNWRRMQILPLSYNDLPAHSKLCMLYMALFPTEIDISVRRLHRLWLAEGFIRRSPGMSEEDTVEDCFDDLAQRNLIKISKFKSDGSPKRCHLPRKLHEYLSHKARQISLFYIHRDHQDFASYSPELGVRRVVEYVDSKNGNPASTSNSSPSYENLRSYLSFNSQRNDTPAKEVGNFISKIIGKKGFGALRVLDLEGVYKPTLPDTLKQLFHLRYLGLRWTFIDYLPKSVGDLSYLETLDLKRTYINSLPGSIWKLKHLRHLNLPQICLDYKQKKCHSSLTELRTLVGLIVDDKSAVEALRQLFELRELGITCQLSSSEELIGWIQQLTNLKFLWLKSKGKMGQPSELNLKPLQKLTQLSHMSLLGLMKTLPTSNQFPPNLKVLALSVSRLHADPMPVLSKLPSLSVLRLLAESYLGREMTCPTNGFQNLRVLKLWMLKELVEWKVEKGSMPNLKKLNIRYCLKLEQVPSQLLQQGTLEELTLTSMPKEFVEKVNDKKQSNTVLSIDEYEFTPLPWEIDPDLWKEI